MQDDLNSHEKFQENLLQRPSTDGSTGRRIFDFIRKSTRKVCMDKTSSTIQNINSNGHRMFPPYQPTNKHWEMTFAALGFDRETIEESWTIFCRINKSGNNEIVVSEFLDYFNMDRTPYIEKCFAYFDTTGGDSIDFLEFMISVWNICTMKIDTLTNFTFDIYDLDSDGELSLPEIELMVQELYNGSDWWTSDQDQIRRQATPQVGQKEQILDDVSRYAEDRGGVLDLTSFTIYTMNHSMLLFPVFQIQRKIQIRVMGMSYWDEIERSRSVSNNVDTATVGRQASYFDPRYVQIYLRTYQTGAAAAVLSHTGDSNEALRLWYEDQEKLLEKNNAQQERAKCLKETIFSRQNKNRTRNKHWNAVKNIFIDRHTMKDTYEKLKRNMISIQTRNVKVS